MYYYGIRAASGAVIKLASEQDEELAISVLRNAGESYASGGANDQILVSTAAVRTLRENGVAFEVLVNPAFC